MSSMTGVWVVSGIAIFADTVYRENTASFFKQVKLKECD